MASVTSRVTPKYLQTVQYDAQSWSMKISTKRSASARNLPLKSSIEIGLWKIVMKNAVVGDKFYGQMNLKYIIHRLRWCRSSYGVIYEKNKISPQGTPSLCNEARQIVTEYLLLYGLFSCYVIYCIVYLLTNSRNVKLKIIWKSRII